MPLRTRPDHHDPNMPVYRNYLMPDGQRREWIDPDYERRYREMLMATTILSVPDWRSDPTYNLRRSRHAPI